MFGDAVTLLANFAIAVRTALGRNDRRQLEQHDAFTLRSGFRHHGEAQQALRQRLPQRQQLINRMYSLQMAVANRIFRLNENFEM